MQPNWFLQLKASDVLQLILKDIGMMHARSDIKTEYQFADDVVLLAMGRTCSLIFTTYDKGRLVAVLNY